MFRLLARLVLIVAVGVWCGIACLPNRTEPTAAPRVWRIDARTLHTAYRDRSERWTGQTVRIPFPAKSYSVVGSDIHWHTDRPESPPDLVAEWSVVLPPPPADGAAIEIVGVVIGCVEDGKIRATGTRFYVRLVAQSVTR